MKPYFLIFISFLIISCKSSKIENPEKLLSENITFKFSKEKLDKCKHICDYVNVKITNKNNVGIYIPSVRDKFFLGIDVNDKKGYIYDSQDELVDLYKVEFVLNYGETSAIKHYKSRKKKKEFRQLKKNTIKNEYDKYFINQLPDSLKKSKKYNIGILNQIEEFKYEDTYFIPANSSIELMIYIQGVMNYYKNLNQIVVQDVDTKYVYKKSKKQLKVYLGAFNEKLSDNYIKIPMKYPKKIGDYHLVRWVKSKDTIINLR